MLLLLLLHTRYFLSTFFIRWKCSSPNVLFSRAFCSFSFFCSLGECMSVFGFFCVITTNYPLIHACSTPHTTPEMLDNNFATIKSNNKGIFVLHICIFICSYYHILCYPRDVHLAVSLPGTHTRYNTHGLTAIALYLMQNGKKHLFLFLITLNKWSFCFSPPEMIA